MSPPGARPRRRKRSPAFLASVGCAIAGFTVALLGAALAGGYALWSRQLMSVQPYGDGVRAAVESAAVQTALGPPVDAGWFVWGTAGPERVSLGLWLHGTAARGTLRILAHRDGELWVYDTLELDAGAEATIDLRDAPAPTVPGPPRSERRAEVVAALDRGALDDAETLAEALVHDHGRWAPAWTARGMVRVASERLGAAEGDFLHALELDPDELDAQIGLGRVQLAREDFPTCMQTFTEVLQYRSHDAAVWLDRARCTEGTGDLRLAVAGARQACVLGSQPGCEMADRLQ